MVNIMDEYVGFTKRCIDKYMHYILDDLYDKKIVNSYTDVYIDVRYSNYMEDASKLTVNKKVLRALSNVTEELKDSVSGNKAKILVAVEHFYKYMYSLDQLYLLEQQKKAINDIYEARVRLLDKEDADFINTFNNILREDIRKRKEFLEAFNSDIFYIKSSKLKKDSHYLRVDIKNKIKFPDLYSQDAILKVGMKPVIHEDITLIGYGMICVAIINDLISGNFDSLYFLELPKSFFDKKTKLARLLNVIDNQFIVEKLRLVVTYECFVRYRTYILELMRKGFIFAIYLDESFDYSSENIEYLVTFDKILMLNGKYYYKDMLNNGTINSRIIVVDEVK